MPKNKIDLVNQIIGNKSYQVTFGNDPTVDTEEKLRIQTHLKYVEEHLRKKEVASLSLALQQKRKEALDLLATYWQNGVFPKNTRSTARIPCFIDNDGRICAVGYLIEQTAGRAMAEQINKDYQHDFLISIQDQRLDQWLAENGLSKEESAMIQPTYDHESEAKVEPPNTGILIKEEPVYTMNYPLDEAIQFYGGEQNLKQFIKKHLNYTTEAKEAGVNGKVFLSFMIDTLGKVENIKVIKGLGYGLDQASIELIQKSDSLQLWTPACHQGKYVKAERGLMIEFDIN